MSSNTQNVLIIFLTLSRRRPLSYRNQSTDLLCKSMDWFLYDNGLRLERVKQANKHAKKIPKLFTTCNRVKSHLIFKSAAILGSKTSWSMIFDTSSSATTNPFPIS